MEHYRIAAAAVTGLLGLCFLIGFFKAFLERIYLGLLGFSFIALAAAFLIAAPALAWLKIVLLVVAGLLFVSAAFFAVVQTMAQMRLIQERRKGLEREMWEYLEQLKQRAAEEAAAADTGQPAESAEASDGDTEPGDAGSETQE
ncbi:MAG: hypothetical protein JSV65_18095 [Armatimonadota bacterium]|nr:MAG: hypothetical protein JSV65_18095 [Armatimonadota bacterium]